MTKRHGIGYPRQDRVRLVKATQPSQVRRHTCRRLRMALVRIVPGRDI